MRSSHWLLAKGRDAAVSLDAVVDAYDAAYGLVTLSVDGGTFLVPAPPIGVGARRRLRIAAGDVSLARHPPQQSTIINVLPARVLSATLLGEHEVTAVLGTWTGGSRRPAAGARHAALLGAARTPGGNRCLCADQRRRFGSRVTGVGGQTARSRTGRPRLSIALRSSLNPRLNDLGGPRAEGLLWIWKYLIPDVPFREESKASLDQCGRSEVAAEHRRLRGSWWSARPASGRSRSPTRLARLARQVRPHPLPLVAAVAPPEPDQQSAEDAGLQDDKK
jgi:hypothetical protein